MNLNKKNIGGYFELEIDCRAEYYKNPIALNSARNCLRYLIRVYKIKELYVPLYTCPVVWRAAISEKCHLIYYEIDDYFFPNMIFPPEAFILYTNYFGICSKNIRKLEKLYRNLIVDNSQSFYSEKMGLASFNSARKFFGVPDGAYLFTEKQLTEPLEYDLSIERISHLLLRIEKGAQEGYVEFQKNDASLNNAPIQKMSRLTHKLLCGIDYEMVAERRRKNFEFLHRKLYICNELEIKNFDDVPMVYPFLFSDRGLREKLIRENIFVACYWNGQKDPNYGIKFQKCLLPLPIDQRYNLDDMQYILEVLNVT